MSDVEYEAGQELDAESQAFLAKEAAEEGKAEKPEFVPTPEFDASKKPEPEDPALVQARAMGWAPKEDWRGDPEKWVDAKTFVERASPKQLLERIEKQERAHQETVSRLEKMNEAALNRQRQEQAAEIARLKNERDEYLLQLGREGRYAEARQVAQRYDAHIENVQSAQINEEDQLKAANDARSKWERSDAAQKDPVFFAAAYQICEEMKQQGKDPAEQLAEVDRRLSSRFPEYYGQQQQQTERRIAAAPAEARSMDGVRVAPSKSTQYASRLPAAARAQGERFVKQGLYPDLEAYAKEYTNG